MLCAVNFKTMKEKIEKLREHYKFYLHHTGREIKEPFDDLARYAMFLELKVIGFMEARDRADEIIDKLLKEEQ